MSKKKTFIIDAAQVTPDQVRGVVAGYLEEHGLDIDIQIHNLPVFTHSVPNEVQKGYLDLWMAQFHAAWDSAHKLRASGKGGAVGKGTIKSPLKDRILVAMKSYRASDATFKEFLKEWTNNPINDLSITEAGDQYIVDDISGELGRKTYSYNSLKQYFSKK